MTYEENHRQTHLVKNARKGEVIMGKVIVLMDCEMKISALRSIIASS